MAPLARKPSISVALNPSCRRTSSLCSPIFGARFRGHFSDAMYLKRARDGGRQLPAGAIERNDDVIRLELRIVDHLLRSTHCSERDVDAVEDLVPMCHRFAKEDLVEDRRKLRHIRRQLRRI